MRKIFTFVFFMTLILVVPVRAGDFVNVRLSVPPEMKRHIEALAKLLAPDDPVYRKRIIDVETDSYVFTHRPIESYGVPVDVAEGIAFFCAAKQDIPSNMRLAECYMRELWIYGDVNESGLTDIAGARLVELFSRVPPQILKEISLSGRDVEIEKASYTRLNILVQLDSVPNDKLHRLKAEAEEAYPFHYSKQYGYVIQGVREYIRKNGRTGGEVLCVFKNEEKKWQNQTLGWGLGYLRVED